MLSISIRPIVAILAHPRVRGTVKRRRGVLCGLFQLAKVTGAYVCIAVCPPHTFNLYRAVMQCARASARHNQLLTHAGPGPLGVSGEGAHCGYTGSAHRCRRFNDTNLSRSYDLPYTSKEPTSMVLTRSTEEFSAPLASFNVFLHVICHLSDFEANEV